MDKSGPNEKLPPCNIDIKRPDKTHITAWRDRSEFQLVYDRIFKSPRDDIGSMEEGEKWLNVWKVRQNREIPICIRCTLVVLEALLFDLRSQRDGRENTTETKNIYAGAFTRFINFLTEGPQNFRWKKKSIAEHVREIGIETYLVELRHLCAHRSVSVSIDVFRRSAQYCMDWLKVSYWERELASMQPVTMETLRNDELYEKLPELTTIFRTYDVATFGRLMGFTTVSQLEGTLKPEELGLLEGVSSNSLQVIAKQMVERLRNGISLPRNPTGIRVMCKAVLANCKHMFLDPVTMGNNSTVPVGSIHSELFRYLASFGCLQAFLERLIAICENENEPDEQRLAAKYWAYKIAMGFQLLRQFKKDCKSLPRDSVSRHHDTSKQTKKLSRRVFHDWFQQTLPKEAGMHLVLGFTIDCPWHLKLSAAYLRPRLTAVNSYTKDTLSILLSLVQPALKHSQQKQIEQLMSIYMGQQNIDGSANGDELPDKTPPKRSAPKTTMGSTEPTKIYTKEDLVGSIWAKRSADEPLDALEPQSKQIKRYGPWSEPQDAFAWENCPLGTYNILNK